MRHKYSAGLVLLVGLLGWTNGRLQQPAPAEEPGVPMIGQKDAADKTTQLKLQRRKLEIAKRTYEAVANAIRIGKERFAGVDLEWSRRWLDCERELNPDQKIAALQAHRERVKEF